MIRSAVLIQYTRVTDGQTDGRTDGIGVTYTRYSIYAVARNKIKTIFETVKIRVDAEVNLWSGGTFSCRKCHTR